MATGLDVLGGLLETKPKVPNIVPIDVGREQQKAISANLNSLPSNENLVSQSNQFSTDQIEKMLAQVIPGYESMKAGVSGNITDLLAGKIPKDVSEQVQNSAAARAIGGGYGGSGFHSNLVSRDLGMTSLDLTGRGISAAESWIGRMASITNPAMMNLGSMFVTPSQEIATDFENQQRQFQRDWMSNQNDAAHSFGTIVGKSLINLDHDVTSAAMAYVGAMGGSSVGQSTSGGDGAFTGSSNFSGIDNTDGSSMGSGGMF